MPPEVRYYVNDNCESDFVARIWQLLDYSSISRRNSDQQSPTRMSFLWSTFTLKLGNQVDGQRSPRIKYGLWLDLMLFGLELLAIHRLIGNT